MNKIEKFIQGMRFIGLRNSLNTIKYSYERELTHTRSRSNNLQAEHLILPGSYTDFIIEKNNVLLNFANTQQEISILDNDLFRITWSIGKLPLPFAINNYKSKSVEFDVHENIDAIFITTTDAEIRVDFFGGLEIYNADKALVRKELPPKFHRKGWEHSAIPHLYEAFYGLGERSAKLNLRGGIYQHWNRDPGGSYKLGDDPLYTCIPVFLGVSPRGSYLIFYENTFNGVFDFTNNASVQFSDGALRYYIIPKDLENCFKRYTELTGCPPLPPKWSLGFHQSRWGYKSEDQIYQLKSKFIEHKLPVNAIHLDIDYMDGYRVFTIDKHKFPDLSKLANDLDQDNIKLVTILDPGIKIDNNNPVYSKGKENNFFVKSKGEEDVEALVWPGWCTFPDFGNSDTRKWWGDHYPYLLTQGVSGIWHDMNEPAIFTAWGEPTLPESTAHFVEGVQIEHREMHNIYGLLMNKAGFEALQIFAPDKRPWILSRSGWAGVQRYAWNWTGDVSSSWQMLKTTVSSLLNLSLSGLYFTGSDIGGFSGHPDPELYIRWFQLGTFSPFFRLHNATGLPDREPWVFDPEILSIVRDLLNLRQQLLPYIYTLSYLAAERGEPLLRPYFWEDPTNKVNYEIDDQFFLGRDLLVAPMLYPSQYHRTVWIPDGVWYNFWNAEKYYGPTTIHADAPLSQIPVFVRGGSVIPLQAGNKLLLRTFFQDNNQPFLVPSGYLYSDAGDGYSDYRQDQFQLELIENRFSLTHSAIGDFPWPYDSIIIKWYGKTFHEIFVDKKKVDFNSDTLELDYFENIVFN